MGQLSFADVRLNYDPSAPQQRFHEARAGDGLHQPGCAASFGSAVARGRRSEADHANAATFRDRRSLAIQRLRCSCGYVDGRRGRRPDCAVYAGLSVQVRAWYKRLSCFGYLSHTAIQSAATLKPAVTHIDSGFKLGRLSPVRDSHGATVDVEPSFTAKEKRS